MILKMHVQKKKLKLGKGKQAATNAIDTSFKARCKSITSQLKMQLRTGLLSYCFTSAEYRHNEGYISADNEAKTYFG